MSHTRIGCREEVDSRLLVVGSQTASLTPGPSFAHNLSCICPNCQCKGIFDIYVSRPFQWHQEHPNESVLGLAVELWTFGSPGGLQIPNFSKCLASPPHLAKVGLRQYVHLEKSIYPTNTKIRMLRICIPPLITWHKDHAHFVSNVSWWCYVVVVLHHGNIHGHS
jgi:hypothetical protein